MGDSNNCIHRKENKECKIVSTNKKGDKCTYDKENIAFICPFYEEDKNGN